MESDNTTLDNWKVTDIAMKVLSESYDAEGRTAIRKGLLYFLESEDVIFRSAG